MPLFQTKELRRFVVCKQCQGQFKEEVLDFKPKSTISSAADEERLFFSTTEMVQMQMIAAAMLYEDQLSKMTQEQEKNYLAFELGVIEYFDRTFLSIGDDESSDIKFFNFLIYYANQNYGDNSEAVFQLWKSLVAHGFLNEKRKLGFDSVNNQVNPDGTKKEGHFPGRYLNDAVGIEL